MVRSASVREQGAVTDRVDSTTILNCGIHLCPLPCHELSDHSRVQCKVLLDDKCENGHVRSWKCFQKPPKDCNICKRLAREALKKREKEIELQQRRDLIAAEHAKKMALLEAELEAKRQEAMDLQLSEDRANIIRQKEKDLALAMRPKTPAVVPSITKQAEKPDEPDDKKVKLPDSAPSVQDPSSSETVEPRIDRIQFKSAARDDWEHQKHVDNAANEAIDDIMNLVGLEDVKSQVLRIKAKIDTSKRQHSDVKKERFNAAFLGNPGTGEYRLSSVQAER